MEGLKEGEKDGSCMQDSEGQLRLSDCVVLPTDTASTSTPSHATALTGQEPLL